MQDRQLQRKKLGSQTLRVGDICVWFEGDIVQHCLPILMKKKKVSILQLWKRAK